MADPDEVVDLLDIYLNNTDITFVYNLSECVRSVQRTFNYTGNWTQADRSENVVLRCLEYLLPRNNFYQPFILPWWQQLAWAIAFGLMVLVAAGGNAIVVWIVLAHRRMRTVTNYFLLNLAMADFLMATSNVIFNFVFMLNSHWPFGKFYCTVNNFIANLTVSTSVFTIFAMSIDRFGAIVRPLSPRMSKCISCVVLGAIWCCGCLLALPTVLYSTVVSYRYPDGGIRTLCLLQWPDGPSGASYSDHIYNILFLLLTYVVPMLSMAVTYPWMCRVLWASRSIGEITERQKDVMRSKQRVVHMLIAVVLIFAICWMPYHIYFLYTYYYQDAIKSDYVQHVYLAIYWLAMSNSVYNPIIYYWMNGRFRGYFKMVLCCCCRSDVEMASMHSWPPIRRTGTLTYSSRTRSCRITFTSSPTTRMCMYNRRPSGKVVKKISYNL